MNQSLAYEFEEIIPAVVESGLPNCTCTITQRSGSLDALGQPDEDPANYTPVSGLINLEAMASIDRPTYPNTSATERMPQQVDTETLVHLLLMGFYPQVQQQNIAVLTGGPYPGTYEIQAVESDSQDTMTRLALRVFTL